MTDEKDLYRMAVQLMEAPKDGPSGLADAVMARLDASLSLASADPLEPDVPDAFELFAAGHRASSRSAGWPGLDAQLAEWTPEIVDGFPTLDPSLRGQSAAVLLRESAEKHVEAQPWASFADSVMARLDGEAAAADARDPLAAEEGVTLTLGELLRAEHDEQLGHMEGKWLALHTQTMDEVARAGSPTGMEAKAVAFFRTEVESEVQEMTPAFEEQFRGDVDRRIEAPPPPSFFDRARAWWESVRQEAMIGWGVGLAGAAAAVMVVALRSGPSGPTAEPIELQAQAHLDGNVSVDAVDFAGDILVVPDDGVTVVMLEGV